MDIMRKNDVNKIYEKIANWMDQQRSRTLFEKSYLDIAISFLKPDSKVLDLGCGTGEPIGQYFIEKGFHVTGVDASNEMLKIAKSRCRDTNFILADMRNLDLNEKFDCIIAWHSYFHLTQDEQKNMFKIFVKHLNKDGVLLFTTGTGKGEVWSKNNGEDLYHASLSPGEYNELLEQYGFKVHIHKIKDTHCGDATVWLAIYSGP